MLQDGTSLADAINEGLEDQLGGSKATPAALTVLHHLLHEQMEVPPPPPEEYHAQTSWRSTAWRAEGCAAASRAP